MVFNDKCKHNMLEKSLKRADKEVFIATSSAVLVTARIILYSQFRYDILVVSLAIEDLETKSIIFLAPLTSFNLL